MSLERSLEETCCDHARDRDVLPKKLGLDGWPDDMFLAHPGRVMFVEFKRPGEKPSGLQRWYIRGLRQLGFRVEVVETIDQFDAALDAWLEEHR